MWLIFLEIGFNGLCFYAGTDAALDSFYVPSAAANGLVAFLKAYPPFLQSKNGDEAWVAGFSAVYYGKFSIMILYEGKWTL